LNGQLEKTAGKTFDEAREEAFEKAGIKDGEFNIAKASEMADPEIGTLTEFTGEMNKKIGCHGPQHPSRPGR